MAATQLYPVTTISKLFNVTDRRVQQLATDVIIPKATRGQYDLIACVQSYIVYLQQNATDNGMGSFDLRGERARLTKGQADSQELKNQIARREVAPIVLLEHGIAKIAQQVAAVLESLPLKIKKRNPHLTSKEIEEIKREIIKAQNEASQLTVDFTRVGDLT